MADDQRLRLLKALKLDVGIEGLAEVEAHLVRDRPVPPRLVARLVRSESTALTPREREVMVLLASAYTRQEIADHLGLTYDTVKAHCKSSYVKLGAHSAVAAINAFLEEA